MSERTSRPETGDVFTVRGLHAYFTLWLTNLEKFYEERDKRYGERFVAQDDKTSLALTGSEKAISKAETATEKRFDAVNEFRGTLSDQAMTLMPRAEANARFANYDEKIGALQKDIQSLRESRSENTGGTVKSEWLIATFIAAVPTVLIIFDLLSRKSP